MRPLMKCAHILIFEKIILIATSDAIVRDKIISYKGGRYRDFLNLNPSNLIQTCIRFNISDPAKHCFCSMLHKI